MCSHINIHIYIFKHSYIYIFVYTGTLDHVDVSNRAMMDSIDELLRVDLEMRQTYGDSNPNSLAPVFYACTRLSEWCYMYCMHLESCVKTDGDPIQHSCPPLFYFCDYIFVYVYKHICR